MQRFFAACAAGAVAFGASAQIIDFQSLEHNDATIVYHGSSYSEDGYTINDLDDANLATFGTLESRYPGSTALFNDTVNGTVELVKDDGGIFSLISIDISRLNSTSPVSVTFIGELDGVVVATQTITTTIDANTLETFAFVTGFLAVDRVTWTQDSPFHQFDNINVVPLGVQVIDFQGLAHNDDTLVDHGFSYDEDGFNIRQDSGNPFGFFTFGTQEARYPGSTALFNNTVDGEIELRDTRNRPFSLLAMDVANLNNNGPMSVTFVGWLRGQVVATQTYTTNGSTNVLEGVVFSEDFRKVDLVTWTQVSPFHQFDNIRVAPVGPAVVDFERLRMDDAEFHYWGYAYSEHGYTVQYLLNNGPLGLSFNTTGEQIPGYPGSTALFVNSNLQIAVLRRDDGGRFDLIAMDVANLNNAGPDMITFEGLRGGSVVAVQSYTTTNANNELETVVFSDAFRDLDAVRWVQDSPYNQFDNITVGPQNLIDFQQLAHNDASIMDHGYSYAEDGMIVRTDPNNPFELGTFGTKESRYAGSTGMFNNTVGGITELVHAGGDRFSVRSIDLATLNGDSPVSVIFHGYLNGNVVVSQVFNITAGDFAFKTFCFDDAFLNIDSLRWSQDSPFHQFDNIVFGNAVGGCPADLDGDGNLDADDFFFYLDAFANGNLDVCNLDGDSDCDADDFFAYLDLFARGC